MSYDTIRWKNNRAELIDQRILPRKARYVNCVSAKDMHDAIKTMIIRGAPAIGIAGAYGVYLGVRGSRAKDMKTFSKELWKVTKYLASSRPTARNLFWALERMEGVVARNSRKSIREIKQLLLKEANRILAEDKKICHAIGSNGRKLIPEKANVLTHCNAGGLATGAYGTALGVIFSSKKKIKMVYVDETRPVLQGARLTVWELMQEGIPTTLICDNMAASIMAKKEIDLIVVGADRIASNGDTANKIGTYGLAVMAKYHKVPFYVAAPVSTFDLSLKTGKDIPIEERSASEVREIKGVPITVSDVDVRNPAFDVTPKDLITAIITEKGVIRRPDREKVMRVVGGNKR
ncbi:MAG: S-methyl-5-thioribose-1-phosphate isomerase [Candidatus Tantalella remota]|nr:S-methyl-5-thioribose-1-phosphate isomerase [Candidatus Tantalella remota]